MQWKEDTTAGSRMSMGRSAYGIRTTTVESTALAQPFCLNQAVMRDLPQRLYAEFVVVRQFSH